MEQSGIVSQNEVVKNYTQPQNEALITLLSLIYRADNKIALSEQDYMDSICQHLNWQSGTTIEAFRAQSVAIVRDKPAEEMIKELAVALSDAPGIIDIAKSIALTDGSVSRSEEKLLNDFVELLKMDHA